MDILTNQIKKIGEDKSSIRADGYIKKLEADLKKEIEILRKRVILLEKEVKNLKGE